MFKQLFAVLPLVLAAMNTESAKKAIDAMLDVLEDQIKKSDTKWDDIVIGNAIKVCRKVANIPDDD